MVVAASILNYWASVKYIISCGFWSAVVVGTVGGAENSLWFAGSWTIPATVFSVSFARIGDRLGRKKLWLLSCVFSFVGSVLTASAHSIGPCVAGYCFTWCLVLQYWESFSSIKPLSFKPSGWCVRTKDVHQPAEILPRRHRGTRSRGVQSGGYAGVFSGLLIGAGLITHNPGGYPG